MYANKVKVCSLLESKAKGLRPAGLRVGILAHEYVAGDSETHAMLRKCVGEKARWWARYFTNGYANATSLVYASLPLACID